MRVGVFSPYLPKHFGGGEKHVLTAAWHFAKAHDVTVLVPTASIPHLDAAREKYTELVGKPLERIRWQASPLADRSTSLVQNWRISRQFDLFLYLTDGSVFFSGAKHSILHIQVPFQNPLSLWQKMKVHSWRARNANSRFTQKVVEHAWKISIPFLHTPFVDTASIPVVDIKDKQKKILAVGRFFDHDTSVMNAKRQDKLIEAFQLGCQQYQWHKLGWELHLVGAVEPSPVDIHYVAQLKKHAAGYPIFFHHDLSAQKLHEQYQTATFFWHACGFKVNETLFPEKVEHFGMATLEAMAHGTVPLVVGKGGQREVVQPNKNGWYWEDTTELVKKTELARSLSPRELSTYSSAARHTAESYSLDTFCSILDEMAAV